MNYDDLAPIYDQQYDTYRDDLHFYAGLAERSGGRVLEIGAGTGRVTAFLTRRGAAVLGVEPSGEMIAGAHARAAREGLTLELVQATAQTFSSDERFGLIIAPFNALMHLYTPAEQLAALQNIRAHLAPGGQFVFDLYVPRFGAMNTLRHEGETFHAPDGSRTDLFFLQRHDAPRQLLRPVRFGSRAGHEGTTVAGGVELVGPEASTQRRERRDRRETKVLLRAAAPFVRHEQRVLDLPCGQQRVHGAHAARSGCSAATVSGLSHCPTRPETICSAAAVAMPALVWKP